MATGNIHGFFWNSVSGDRTYDAESFESWLKKFFTTGVFQGELEVTEYSSMTVSVGSGYANLDGKVIICEQDTHVTLDAPNSTYPRIDTIVVQRDNTDRTITIEKVTGEYSGASPRPTAPVRNAEIFQIVLAQIYVGAGVSNISQADITDTRPDKDICGYVTGTVEQIDFDQITAQFEAYISEFEANQKADFEAWFAEMKDQLSTDAAGHLQAEIDVINNNITDINEEITDVKNKVKTANDKADAATASINNVVAALATSKHIFNIAGVTHSSGGTNANSTFAKKTGNVIFLNVTAIFNNSYALYEDITELMIALNNLPLAWRKGLPYRTILPARIGTNMSCINCRVNQTTYNFETVNTQLAFSAGTSISIVGSWVVDN